MSAQLKELIDRCSICQSVKPEQASEPLHPCPVPDRPWQRVATDLFTLENRDYLVLVDYFSNFIELDYPPDTSSLAVIRKLKMHGSSSMLLPHRTILKQMGWLKVQLKHANEL